jgi:hypothetical protein
MLRRGLTISLCVLLLTGCALGDVPEPTAGPPLTVQPGPTPVFAGDCIGTRELNQWLESSTFYAAQFTEQINALASANRNQVYAGVLELVNMRNALSTVPTPDCAEALHRLLLDAMETGINAYQAYANGDAENISSTVAEVVGQIDRVNAGHNELIARLQTQFEAERGGGS